MHNLSSARILPKDSHEVEFLPGTICKSSLSPAKVQERQEACTAIHLASLQQDEAFKKWHQSSQRRQWIRQPRSYQYLLLGAVTALAIFLLLVAAISLNRPIDLSAAHLLNGAASQTTSDSPGEHADIHNKEVLQAKSRQSGAQHRVDTALIQRQLATPQQQEKEQKQENIALDTARDKVSDEEPAAHLKNLPFEQQQKQQKSQAAVQPIEGQQQIIDVGIGTQTQQQFHDINQRLSAAERESIEKTSHLDTTAQTATFAPLKREHGQLGRQRLHVAPPLWALQQVAHAKQCVIEHTKALRLWQLLAEIIATAMALYFALRLLLGFTNTKDLNSIQAAMPTRAGADALPVKKRQFADRLSDNQSVPPTQQHEAAAKAESAATSGRIRQVVSYKEAVALGEAQKQLEGMGHDLIAAKAQVKTSSAHAAALQKQLAKVKLELEASTADTSRLNDQQQAFQRELDQARALEAQLVVKVQDAETLQAKALSQLEDTASKAAVTASALTAQAAQTADARRALEAKDVERAEIVQELQELRSSFQTVKRGREEAQKALHKALQRSEMASCRAQETAKKLSDQHAAVEQMKGDMQKAARAADEQIESLSRDRKTLARHLEDAQARLSQVDSPRKSSRSGRRSDSGQTSNNLLPTSSTLLRCQSSADSLKSQVDDSAASETTGRADNLQSQLLEAQAEIRTLQQRSDRAEQTMLVAKQGQADAEAAARQAREDLSEADREQELLEAQLEQLTGSLRHTSARKQELETELHNFRQKLDEESLKLQQSEAARQHAGEELATARTAVANAHDASLRLIVAQRAAEEALLTHKEDETITAFWERSAAGLDRAATQLSASHNSAASWPIDDLAQGMEVLTPAAKSFVTAALRFCNVQRRHATLQEARFREAQRQEAPHHQTEAGGTTFQSEQTSTTLSPRRTGIRMRSVFNSPSLVRSAQALSSMPTPTASIDSNAARFAHGRASIDLHFDGSHVGRRIRCIQGESTMRSSDDSLAAAAQHFSGMLKQVASMQGRPVSRPESVTSSTDGRLHDPVRLKSPLRSPLSLTSPGVVDTDSFKAWFGSASSCMHETQGQLATPPSSGTPSLEGESHSAFQHAPSGGFSTNPLFENATPEKERQENRPSADLISQRPQDAAAAGKAAGAGISTPRKRSLDEMRCQEMSDDDDDVGGETPSPPAPRAMLRPRQQSVTRCLVLEPSPRDSTVSGTHHEGIPLEPPPARTDDASGSTVPLEARGSLTGSGGSSAGGIGSGQESNSSIKSGCLFGSGSPGMLPAETDRAISETMAPLASRASPEGSRSSSSSSRSSSDGGSGRVPLNASPNSQPTPIGEAVDDDTDPAVADSLKLDMCISTGSESLDGIDDMTLPYAASADLTSNKTGTAESIDEPTQNSHSGGGSQSLAAAAARPSSSAHVTDMSEDICTAPNPEFYAREDFLSSDSSDSGIAVNLRATHIEESAQGSMSGGRPLTTSGWLENSSLLPQPRPRHASLPTELPPASSADSGPRSTGAIEQGSTARTAAVSLLEADVAAEEVDEITAQSTRDPQRLLQSVWDQLEYVMEPALELRQSAERLISSPSPSHGTGTQTQELDQLCRKLEAADEHTLAVATLRLHQAEALRALEQRSDDMTATSPTHTADLERQIETAHLQLAGIQVDIKKAAKIRWEHQSLLQEKVASYRGFAHIPPPQPQPLRCQSPHLADSPRAVARPIDPHCARSPTPTRASCNASSIGGTSIPSSIRSMAGAIGLLGLLESPEPSNATMKSGSNMPRLMGGVVMRSTDGVGAPFAAAPAAVSPTASSPLVTSLSGLEPSDLELSIGSMNSDSAGLSRASSSTNELHNSPTPHNL